MSIEDMPEVPSKGPLEEQKHLELPDVPTKAPVAPKVVADDSEMASAELSTKKKGLSLSLSLSHFSSVLLSLSTHT